MPAFLTHWRILIATANQSQDAGSDLGSLIINPAALRQRNHGWATPPQTTPAGAVWDTGPFPEIDFPFPGSDISAQAFLGALAPDILYFRRRSAREKYPATQQLEPAGDTAGTSQAPHWSDLFHRSHSGEILITFLEQIALVPSPALRSQALAFALGYVSHIATDIALNPWINALAERMPARKAPAAQLFIEARLDEYQATTFFEHPRYHLLHQPWGAYIEPVAHNLRRGGTLELQILQLLAAAAEIYQLDETQTARLPADFLAGLQEIQHLLAGRGRARWQTLRAPRQQKQQALLKKMLAETRSDGEIIALDNVLAYAERLSTLLCKRAIHYYTALRNPNAEASERSSRRAALVNDLRNWDLATGYVIDEKPSGTEKLHNWVHFANLWEQTGEEQAPRSLLSKPGA
jgi:hypothetical protein